MRLKLLVACIAAAFCAVPSANAGLLDPITQLVLPTCGAATQPFRAVDGDTRSYYGFANNGFELGSTGWTLGGGAYVGFGNEPWYAGGFGARSLVLPAGASATIPGFCINLLDPTVRMFARGTNGGDLKIQVIFRGLTGNITGVLNHVDQKGTGSWAATGSCSSLLGLPLLTAYAQIRVTSVSGTFQVDDAYVDPWIAGG